MHFTWVYPFYTCECTHDDVREMFYNIAHVCALSFMLFDVEPGF